MPNCRFIVLALIGVAFLCVGDCRADPLPFSEQDQAQAAAAFRAVNNRDWALARDLAARSGLPGLVAVIEESILSDDRKGQPLQAFQAFLTRYDTWPRRNRLIATLEARFADRKADSQAAAWYAGQPPVTAIGKAHLARILDDAGERANARRLALEAWGSLDLPLAAQTAIGRRFGDGFSADINWARLDRLLWAGRQSQARDMLRWVSPEHRLLASARLALRSRAPGVDAAIKRVPAALSEDPGLIYERVRWRRIHGLDEGARDLLIDLPDPLPEAARWWPEIRLQIRSSLDENRMAMAYHLARNHGQTAAGPKSEAEWLAGWIALRFLDRPYDALVHFDTMYAAVRYPISLSRAAYWAGRAAGQTGHQDIALAWYRIAAGYQQTFYGQLAAEALGRDHLTLRSEFVPDRDQTARFDRDPVVQAALLLGLAGRDKDMLHYVRYLSDRATTPDAIALVARLGGRVGLAHIGIAGAKWAMPKGLLVTSAAYPVPIAAPSGNSARPDFALILAVARQESEMNSKAVSRAGARGLMQLMPGTAKEVTKSLGLAYSRTRLTGDPVYNVTLGSHYLAGLLRRFSGNPVLALAAYNAGPGRADQWIGRNGDPRNPNVDAIDWIERIPFAETRNYVQRVLEGAQVYRHILGDEPARLVLGAALDRVTAPRSPGT